MASYTGTADRPDRAKAITAVIAVHAVLAAIILSGLNVRMVGHASTVEDLRHPRAARRRRRPRQGRSPGLSKRGGPPARKRRRPRRRPSSRHQPELRFPRPSRRRRSPARGVPYQRAPGPLAMAPAQAAMATGWAAAAATASPRRRRSARFPIREYRRLVAASGMDRGMVGVTVRVTARRHRRQLPRDPVERRSAVDALMCQLTERYVRFRPARDPNGRAIAQDISWYPNWCRP